MELKHDGDLIEAVAERVDAIALRRLFPELREDITEIKKLLEQIAECLPLREYFSADEVCQMLGISRDQARTKPYLMPNYGLSDFPGRAKKWLPATVRAWLKVPPVQHERTWKMMSEAERRRIVDGTA